MQFIKYFREMTKIQYQILEFINDEDCIDIQNFFKLVVNKKIYTTKQNLISVLYLISNISDNCCHTPIIIHKIEQFLLFLKKDILNFFSNEEIFTIFKRNKKILLFLFNNKFIFPDEYSSYVIKKTKYFKLNYPHFFYNEFRSFFDEKLRADIESSLENICNYEEKRLIGENDHYICELIRNDSINEFISFINSNNISDVIETSIFETNLFLLDKNPSLIEYSAFYGSINIFKYLYLMNFNIFPSIWFYAIHGKNNEIIHFLEEKRIDPPFGSFYEVFIESIKCHHNEIAEYIEMNYLENFDLKSNEFIQKVLKCYNFHFLSDDFFMKYDYLFDYCKYNYYIPFKICSKMANFDVNSTKDNTLLSTAVKKGNIKIVKRILKFKNLKINKIKSVIKKDTGMHERKSALIYACKKGFVDIVDLLLKNPKIDVNKASWEYIKFRNYKYESKYSPLVIAILDDKTEIVKLLLKQKNLNVNNEMYFLHNELEVNKTPLNIAISRKNIAIVKLLLDHPNINVNEETEHIIEYPKYTEMYTTPLSSAIELNNIDIIKLLLNHPKIDVNSLSIYCEIKGFRKKFTPLFQSINKKDININVVKLLLNHPKIDINSKSFITDKRSYSVRKKIQLTALHCAVNENKIEIVNLLLDQPKIDVNIKMQYYSLEYKKINSVICIVAIFMILFGFSNKRVIFYIIGMGINIFMLIILILLL